MTYEMFPQIINFVLEKDFFQTIFSMTRLVGSNPKDQGLIYKLVIPVHFVATVFTYIFGEFHYVYLSPDTFIDTITTTAAVCYHILATIKCIHTFLKIETYYELYEDLNRKSFNFENCGFELLQQKNNIWRNVIKKKVKVSQINQMKIRLKLLHRKIKNIKENNLKWARMKSYGIFGAIMSGAIFSLIFSYWSKINEPLVFEFHEKLNKTVLKNEIPYKTTFYFFDVTDPVEYRYCFFYSGYTLTYLTAVFIISDSLYHGLFTHLSAQVQTICEMIRMIKVPFDMKSNKTSEANVTDLFLKCTKEIQKCIEYVFIALFLIKF